MYQASLLALDEPGFDPSFASLEHRDLGRGAWVDVVAGWVRGSDVLFERLCAEAPFEAHTRVMWDEVVDEPRLSTRHWPEPPAPIPAMAAALGERYGLDLGGVSANLYRHGRDSVAWHGDTAGRYRERTVVAIVSLGSPRRFHLRPKGGGPSQRFLPAHGDLLVLGGTCQRTFDHAVPKMAQAGPRISVMFREPGVF